MNAGFSTYMQYMQGWCGASVLDDGAAPPTMMSGISASEVWGEAPSEINFGVFWSPQNSDSSFRQLGVYLTPNRSTLQLAGKVGSVKWSKNWYSVSPRSYGKSHAMWGHTVLPATWQRYFPAFTSSKAGTRFSDSGGFKAWVD